MVRYIIAGLALGLSVGCTRDIAAPVVCEVKEVLVPVPVPPTPLPKFEKPVLPILSLTAASTKDEVARAYAATVQILKDELVIRDNAMATYDKEVTTP